MDNENATEQKAAFENIWELLSDLKKKNVEPKYYNQYIMHFLESKARKKKVPINGSFELTPLCNLDCKMCYVHLQKEQTKGKALPDVSQWKQLIKESHDEGMISAKLTGGECLTYPGFEEIYRYLISLGIKVLVYTNGIILDRYFDLFVKHPPKVIQVSVYGYDNESYVRVSGKPVFDIVMQNISKARELELPISIAVTPSKFIGVDGTKKIIKMLYDDGYKFTVNSTLFDPCEDTGRSGENNDLTIEDYIKIYTYQREIQGLSVKLHSESELPKCGGNCTEPVYGLKCGAGSSSFNITWKGEMLPCAMLKSISNNPFETGFKAAWKMMTDEASRYPIPIECEGCAYEDYCTICVTTHEENGGKKGHAGKHICLRAVEFAKAGITESLFSNKNNDERS